jgi:hypothetical protein
MEKYFTVLRALFIAVLTLILTIMVCVFITEYAPLWLEIVFFGTCWIVAIGYLTLLIYSKLKK